MTSHVAYVIYATITLITTQGLCNTTFFLCLIFPFMHLGPYLYYDSYLLFLSFHIHAALLTLCRSGIKSITSTCNRSRLNAILEGFLKTT